MANILGLNYHSFLADGLKNSVIVQQDDFIINANSFDMAIKLFISLK